MIPAIPESDRAKPFVFERYVMIENCKLIDTANPTNTTSATNR